MKTVWIKLGAGMMMLHPLCAAAQQQTQDLTLKLKPAEVDIVGKALGKLPYEEVAALIQNLRQQIMDQQRQLAGPGGVTGLTQQPPENK